MADTKISGLTAITMPASLSDLIPVVDSVGVSSKKMTLAQLAMTVGHVWDVQAYGAVGDGTTSDTTAINAAITACSAAGGGVVWVPKTSTSYRCSAVTLDTNVWLMSDGATLKSNAVNYVLFAQDKSNILVSGLIIDGNDQASTHTVRFIRCTNVVFDNVVVTKGESNGFTVQSGEVTFRHCTASNNGLSTGVSGAGFNFDDDGASGGKATIKMTDCISFSNGLGVGLDGAGLLTINADIEVTNFVTYSNTRYGIKHMPGGTGRYVNIHSYSNQEGFSTPGASNVSITGLYIHDTTEYGLWLDAACTDISVDNFYIDTSTLSGIRSEANCKNIRISNGVVKNSVLANIQIYPTGNQDITFVNVHSWDAGTGGTNTQTGWIMETTTRMTLIGCSARDTRAGTARAIIGFDFDGATEVNFIGCYAPDAEFRTSGIYSHVYWATTGPYSGIVGVPKTPTYAFTVPTGYQHTVQDRLTISGSVMRATLAGTADLILTDNFESRPRIVLAGRG